jgi:hypothetical protein
MPDRTTNLAAAPSRWRERVRGTLRTLLAVVPLTVLIWVYAERAQQDTKDLSLDIRLRPADAAAYIAPENAERTVTVTVRGPRSRLEALRGQRQVIDLPVANRSAGRSHELLLAPLLNQSSFADENGVEIASVTPSTVDVYIDGIEEREIKVVAPELTARLQGPVVFQPTSVRVRGPVRLLDRFTQSDGTRSVQADMAGLEQLRQGGTHEDVQVTLRSPSPALTLTPPAVTARFTVMQEQIRDVEVPSVIIAVSKPLAMEGRYAIEVNPTVLANVKVSGPADVIGPWQASNFRQPKPAVAVLRITADDLQNAGKPAVTREVSFDLPEGVRAKGPPPTVEFRLVEVAPASR